MSINLTDVLSGAPSSRQLLTAVLPTAVLVYLISKVVCALFFHPLSAYPGPLIWRIESLPLDLSTIRGTIALDKARLHEKYGPIIRIRPHELSYISAQAWKDIYAYNPGKPEFPKDPSFSAGPPNGLPNILIAEKEPHARYRRVLAHAFSEKGLREQAGKIRGFVDLFIERLTGLSKAGETVDMTEWFNMVNFDLIGDLAFGESFGSLEQGKLHSWIKAVQENVKYSLVSAVYKKRGLSRLVPYLMDQSVIANRVANYRLTKDKMDRRMEHIEECGDFWDKIIAKSSNNDSTGEGMSSGEMLNNAIILILGGSETSATTLSGAIYLLGKNPDKLKKLVDEVRAAYRKSEDIDVLSVAQLKYMSAVIDETMRVYPAVPGQAARTTPPSGAFVEGRWLPKNTTVSVSAIASSKIGWASPDEFTPERYLANPEPEFVNDPRAAFQPFSMGTRNCIGRNLAFVELRLILAKFLWHFDVELQEKQKGDFLKQKSWAIWWKNPVYVKLKVVER